MYLPRHLCDRYEHRASGHVRDVSIAARIGRKASRKIEPPILYLHLTAFGLGDELVGRHRADVCRRRRLAGRLQEVGPFVVPHEEVRALRVVWTACSAPACFNQRRTEKWLSVGGLVRVIGEGDTRDAGRSDEKRFLQPRQRLGLELRVKRQRSRAEAGAGGNAPRTAPENRVPQRVLARRLQSVV